MTNRRGATSLECGSYGPHGKQLVVLWGADTGYHTIEPEKKKDT